jgi:hypothetical protein
MFERLVSDIRKYHVFSSVWPEEAWVKELPALEREVFSALDRDRLSIALRHVSNSLRDGHLTFTPAGVEGAEGFATLPVSFASVGDIDHPWYVITHSDRRSGVSLGDFLLSYDGVPREKLLDHYRFELNAATPAARSSQLTEFLRRRSLLGYPASGLRVPATFRHGAHTIDTDLVFERRASASSTPSDRAPSHAPCPTPAREYDAAYELIHTGTHVCTYRASNGPFAAYPIIWHGSFMYEPAQLAADRDLVRDFVASVPGAAGIVLDLRSNGGGISAEYVLPWYAPRPHQAPFEWVTVHLDLDDRTRLRRTLRSDAAVEEYRRRALDGDRWWVRPFDCGREPCPKHQTPPLVGSIPVALLLGPGCRSACDELAAVWTRERFGPTIGSAPAAMYTSLRYPLPVTLGNEPLGELTIALCGLRFQESDPWLEGRLLQVDTVLEPSWPSADYGAKLLEAARSALLAWRAAPVPMSSRAASETLQQ